MSGILSHLREFFTSVEETPQKIAVAKKSILPTAALQSAKEHGVLVAVRPSVLKGLQDAKKGNVSAELDKQKKEKLSKLHEKDKANPEAVRERVQKYVDANRDKINERRREQRKEKAAASKHTVKENGAVVEF